MSDAFSLLDKVLLHEMTHGRSAYTLEDSQGRLLQEGLKDVLAPRSGAGFFSYQSAAYGWSKAGAMARQAPPSTAVSEQVPDNNADSLALFGSSKSDRLTLFPQQKADRIIYTVCKLMDDPTNPRKVDAKGRIVPRT